jgi:hypothetical protein
MIAAPIDFVSDIDFVPDRLSQTTVANDAFHQEFAWLQRYKSFDSPIVLKRRVVCQLRKLDKKLKNCQVAIFILLSVISQIG